MQEHLKKFNAQYEQIGEASRAEAHNLGHWHEVFHCWVLEYVNHEWRIYLQLRSKDKLDYPGQFDITAAGHLLVEETIEDGVREMHEELGILLAFSELISLGVIPYAIDNERIKDYEYVQDEKVYGTKEISLRDMAALPQVYLQPLIKQLKMKTKV